MRAILLFIPLLISCYPHRLVPHDYSIEKNNIEALVELDSVVISLTNLEIKSDHFVFGMGVQNQSSKTIFINSNNFTKYGKPYSYLDSTYLHTIQEIIPAMSTKQVDQFFTRKKQNAEAAAVFLFFIGAVVTTYDAIKDVQDESKSHWTEEDNKKALAREAVTTSTVLLTDALTEVAFTSQERAATELKYLSAELFDEKFISPGDAFYGKVLFRRVGELQRYHRVRAPFKKENLIFDFRKATPKERRFLFEQGY